MRPHIEALSKVADCMVSAYPNAGLPNELGEYDQTPQEMEAYIRDFVSSGFVNIIGGCCGTTPEHIRAMVNAVEGMTPRPIQTSTQVSSYSGLEPLIIRDNMNFINIGERTNVTGSARVQPKLPHKGAQQNGLDQFAPTAGLARQHLHGFAGDGALAP